MVALHGLGDHPVRFTLLRGEAHFVDRSDLLHGIGRESCQVLEVIGCALISYAILYAVVHAVRCRARASPSSIRLTISCPYQSFRLVRKLVKMGLLAKQSPI